MRLLRFSKYGLLAASSSVNSRVGKLLLPSSEGNLVPVSQVLVLFQFVGPDILSVDIKDGT